MVNETKITKKVLVVDDSALMRRVFCDIINNDERFEVADRAINGLEALECLKRRSYDAVVLDINMPKMNGLELLRELRRQKISAKVMLASTEAADGAAVTMEALSLGALDFIQKPGGISDCCMSSFKEKLLGILSAVADSKGSSLDAVPVAVAASRPAGREPRDTGRENVRIKGSMSGEKIVAMASSTGGPRALQAVLPYLPKHLDAPVLLVQHMPREFTASLAERLNDLSSVKVKEAVEGEELCKGTVYLSMGGQHMTVRKTGMGRHVIHYTDEPAREGVKPSANYMYESLSDSSFDHVICVVMTGMGADGTAGIRSLKEHKSICVIAQNQETCTVYGMPKSVVNAGLSDREVPLEQIAHEIVLRVGVCDA